MGGGGIYVQRGTATKAGTVTINEVDMDKTFVLSVSKGSDGYVATRGTISGADLNIPSKTYGEGKEALMDYAGESAYYSSTFPKLSGTISSTTLSGGSTNLTVKEYSATLTSSTALYCDGACEWQVIEIK